MIEPNTILNAFATLFVIIDPIGLAPLFLAITDGMSGKQRNSVALRASIISLFLLTLFLIAGQRILDTMGITIHAFRVAGGLLLFYTAFEMVFGARQERKEKTTQEAIGADQIAHIAVFPLALPLIAGPGAISATILLSSEVSGLEWQFILFGIITFVIVLVWFSFTAAQKLDRFLGNTGRMILTRLLGVLLAALSVQYVVDGLKALWQA